MTRDTTWRASWRRSRGALPSGRTPAEEAAHRARDAAEFAAADQRNAERRAARLAEPEPVYISSARLDAVEKALDAGMKAATGALEWKELLEEKSGTCLRNERHEDMSWELCGQPTQGTAMYCPRHMLDALGPPQAGNIPVVPVASTITPPANPTGFDAALDPAVDEVRHARVGYLPPLAWRPASETRRNKWGLRSSRSAAPPAEPVNPTIEREREGQEFPVRVTSRTEVRLSPCDENAAHGFHDEGKPCPGCMKDLQQRSKEDERTARKRAQATERQRRHRLFTTKAAK
jgi:hypothetical protein